MKEQSPHLIYDPSYFPVLFEIEDWHFWFRTRNRVVAAMVKRLVADLGAGYRVLEIGCGTGNVLRVLEKVCGRGVVIGLDLFLDGLRYARQRTDATLIQGDMRRLPFGVPFDVIGLFDVLEHLPDDERVLEILYGLLEEDGRLLLTVPAFPSLWSYFDDASCHCRRYKRNDLVQKLIKAGYEVETASYFMVGIFPLVWAGRRASFWLNRRGGKREDVIARCATSELRVKPVINEVLAALMALEPWLLARGCTFPWGTSLLAVARKGARTWE